MEVAHPGHSGCPGDTLPINSYMCLKEIIGLRDRRDILLGKWKKGKQG